MLVGVCYGPSRGISKLKPELVGSRVEKSVERGEKSEDRRERIEERREEEAGCEWRKRREKKKEKGAQTL